MSKLLQGSGSLPTKCPNCNNNTYKKDWIWIKNIIAKCPKCKKKFGEKHEYKLGVVGWWEV